MKFDVKVVHKAWSKHPAAYALSRLRTNGSDHTMLKDSMPIVAVPRSNKQVLNSLKADTDDGSYDELISTFGNDRHHY